MRVYEIPEGSKTSKGRAIQNLINIDPDDKVKAFINTQDLKDGEYINSHYVIMATKMGQVVKTSLEKYSRPRSNGINAITIKDNDELLEAKLTTGKSQILLAVKSGKAIRFEEDKTRPLGRGASGVRGIKLKDEKDEVVGMVTVESDSDILVVSENGYGKRSSLDDYRITNRGGKGIIGIINSPRNGDISASLVVSESDEIILSTDKGSIMRCAVKEIRVAGRNTQGVRIKKLSGTEKVVSVIKIEDNIQ